MYMYIWFHIHNDHYGQLFKVMLLLHRPVALHGLEAIYRDGKIVGYIRRGEFAFALDKEIAWGYVSNPEGGPVNKDYVMSGKRRKLIDSFSSIVYTYL